MPRYKVKSPLKHDGKIYEVGVETDLPADVGKYLVSCGTVERVTSKSKPETEPETVSEESLEPQPEPETETEESDHSDYVLDYGKHEGKRLSELDDKYLRYLSRSGKTEELMAMAKAELASRTE